MKTVKIVVHTKKVQKELEEAIERALLSCG